MRWLCDKRADPVHAWGAIAAGIAIAAALYAARALDPHQAKTWWWPTNWMIFPAIIIVAGLVLLAFPVRRSLSEDPAPSTAQTSKTLNGVTVGGNTRLTVDTSADQFAYRTQFTGNAQVSARHFPGSPNTLADSVESPHGQEGQAQAEGAAEQAEAGKAEPRDRKQSP